MCTEVSKYPWQTIDPKDFIHIESNQDLTMQDVRILTKLYKPIIGNSAYSFYQSLFSELDFRANYKLMSVSKLLRKMDVGLADFYHARIRLEGLGLLRIYRLETDQSEYIYELNNPLSTRDFLEDSLLQTLIMEKIGENLFKEEVEDLVSEGYSKENYEELTRSFTDVYHFNIENKELAAKNHLIPLKTNNKAKIVDTIENVESFDYQFFKEGLNKHFIRQNSLNEEIKELIYTYHLIYGIDELTMQSIVLESADVESGKINKNKLTNTVQRMYLNKQRNQMTAHNPVKDSTGKSVKNTEQKKAVLSKKGFTPSEISVIKHAKQTAPANYLRSIKYQKNGFVTSNETWLLKELVEQSPLSREVINILLHYILVIQKAVVLDKNYATKIANDWAQSDIKTAEDAVVKLRDIFSQSKNNSTNNQMTKHRKQYKSRYGRPVKKENLPDWAKEENKKENTKENQLLSTQDEDALKVRLEKIRRQRESKEDS